MPAPGVFCWSSRFSVAARVDRCAIYNSSLAGRIPSTEVLWNRTSNRTRPNSDKARRKSADAALYAANSGCNCHSDQSLFRPPHSNVYKTNADSAPHLLLIEAGAAMPQNHLLIQRQAPLWSRVQQRHLLVRLQARLNGTPPAPVRPPMLVLCRWHAQRVMLHRFASVIENELNWRSVPSGYIADA